MRRFVRAAVCLAALAMPVIGGRLSWAQTTSGQISGTVQDPGGAVVPGAVIAATNIDTQVTRTVESGPSGAYLLALLPPGNYQLVISKPSFESITERDIKLDVNQSISINAMLTVGSASISVEVQGSSELLNASSASLGTVIDERSVNDLPLNGRNFTQLLTLVPGATPISTSQAARIGVDDGSTIALPGSSFSNPAINGQQNRETLYLLDGVVNTDFRTTTYTVLPIIDGISEFKVQSHNDDPAFGSVLGGVVNLITRSGTNQFHGSAWEFVRNTSSTRAIRLPTSTRMAVRELPALFVRTNTVARSAARSGSRSSTTAATRHFSSSAMRLGDTPAR